MTTEVVLTTAAAKALEEKFLLAIGDAQSAYEQIIEHQAWNQLGFDTLGGWWDARVRPVMTALSMRPTPEIAASVVEQVRAEEAELPTSWRRRDYELAAMVGATPDEIRDRSGRSTTAGIPANDDLAATPQPDADAIDDVPLWDEPAPAAAPMPARQDIADLIASRLDQVVAAQAKPALPAAPDEARERDYQASSEAWSRNLAKCVYLLAGFSNLNGFVEKALKEWQPSQDIYPDKTTAERMRTAAAYLNAIAERWPA